MTNVFQGDLVRLRAVEPSDAKMHYEWDLDTDAARLSYMISFPQSREAVRSWAEREGRSHGEDDHFRFQIVSLETDALVGTINIHTTDQRNRTFRYGIAVMRQYYRMGFGSEAIRLVLRYFFHERNYQKCNVDVYAFNEPSIGLHERLGFVQEGRLRRMIYTEGTYHDVLVYGITREEFESQTNIQ